VAPWRPRKIIKTRGQFPNEAATNLIWQALRNMTPWSGRRITGAPR